MFRDQDEGGDGRNRAAAEKEPDRTRSRRVEHPGRKPNRRSFLRATTAATAAGLMGAGPAAATGRYRSVVDIVDDLGADPTGEEPINAALDRAISDDTKVIFPEGTYLIGDGGFWRLGDNSVSNVALVGQGDVTLRPNQGFNSWLLVLWGDGGVRVENFRVDQTAPETTTSIAVKSDDDLAVRDVLIDGVSDIEDPGGVNNRLLPAVTDPDGTGVIENFHAPDGSVPSRHGGSWVYTDHAGDLVYRRCSFEGFADNAIYASGPGGNGNGAVGVENCFFRNNNVSSIRLGTPGSYAKNCTVVYDEEGPPELPWGAVTGRAVWLWYDFDGYVKNCDIVVEHERGNGIVYYPSSPPRSGDVYNTRIELNEPHGGVDRARSGLRGIWCRASGEEPVTFRNVSITGDVSEYMAVSVHDRDAVFENCCITQTGLGRDGIELRNSDSTIRNSLIDATGEAIVAGDDSDVTVTGRRENGGCPSAQPHHSLDG